MPGPLPQILRIDTNSNQTTGLLAIVLELMILSAQDPISNRKGYFMNGFEFFRVVRTVAVLVVAVIGALVVLVGRVYGDLSREASYKQRYGDDWKLEFEADCGSLVKARTQTGVAAAGIVIIPSILLWLYRSLRPPRRDRRSTHAGRESKPQRKISRGERVVRYRRNAIIGNYFGVSGIFAGVLLEIVHLGIFEDHSDEMVLGVFVFLGGYCGVVSGCWCWLKAKAWREEVVFIAFIPLTILFIPFVRLILLASPAILLVSMVMMPLILLVVVFVLPDHSHVPKKRSDLNWLKANQHVEHEKE